jgi:iron only hydrogenase large subunit-like protein
MSMHQAGSVQDLGDGPLEMRKVRNEDLQEMHVCIEGRAVLSAAKAYGFRNIQNLVRKIKAGSCPYHIVEVMACPSGAF